MRVRSGLLAGAAALAVAACGIKGAPRPPGQSAPRLLELPPRPAYEPLLTAAPAADAGSPDAGRTGP